MSAQRKRNIHTVGIKNYQKLLFYLLGSLLALLGIFVLRAFDTRYWDGVTKLHIAYVDKDDNVEFSVFDPEANEITSIRIPGDTQVEVARQLGIWKLKNVWKLGEQEKVGGKLLAETLTREFHFPVYTWVKMDDGDLTHLNLLSAITFIFKPVKTNLTTGDKVRLSLFASQIQQSNKRRIDLSETSYIKKTIVTDGSEGYVVSGKMPSQIISLLTYPLISQKTPAYVIVNRSGDAELPEKLGEVISVMGGKIASIEKASEIDSDCTVVGKDRGIVAITAHVFSCTVGDDKSKGNLDVQISIGKKFAERY